MNSPLPEDTQCIALVISQAQASSFMRGIGFCLQSFTFNGRARAVLPTAQQYFSRKQRSKVE
ncbi:hypothetical protein AVDCRST_MAG92-4303 [uncultured Coleofasciculus sp.]|uniref:Uncharacterized protein n=1 Tax=uncultured Coleofasciculus sp. TaxID=1267456 RepID=A0A6J4JZE0_9CYAN|nr:hypothetical protein AVDCRST_MAG92-4303 [uncultured Coleofasciculus sp.]